MQKSILIILNDVLNKLIEFFYFPNSEIFCTFLFLCIPFFCNSFVIYRLILTSILFRLKTQDIYNIL